MPAPFHPTRAFQAYQLFAANTNVGKTVFATGLCRAAALLGKEKNRNVFYLKPVQTGYPADSDERHVKTYNSSTIRTQTLYTYPDPVSPHIATNSPPEDAEVMQRTKQWMLDSLKGAQDKSGSFFFLETAGGIHSPVMSGTPQADFYRPLRLPSILVGDGNLGGISTTMTSYESLMLRGYDIPAVLLFDKEYRNHELLQRRLKVDVTAVPPPPAYIEDPVHEQASMKKYYEQLDEYLYPVMKRLDQKHEQRFDRLEQMADKSREVFWWPFTQHETVKDVTVIDSAYNDYFLTYAKNENKELEPKEMFDSCASWWTQGLGHGNPDLALTAAHAAGRYGHVMFPEATNEPALALAEKVLEKDTWASRVFVSDNGSTAMEVALKMAMSATGRRYGWAHKAPIEILGIDGSYHGDTIGAMDACSANVYNEQVQWYQPRGHWLTPPSVHITKGQAHVRVPAQVLQQSHGTTVNYDSVATIYSVDKQGENRDPELASIYKDYIRSQLKMLRDQKRHIGAVLMEPVLMGAGGMIFVDPLFQRVLVDTIRQESADLLGYSSADKAGWQGLPVVFDEVFAGWYRLGRQSASDFLGVKPDIAAYAKTLTGGLLPLALTVTKEPIFDIFLSKNKPDCLLHGHSYTAHPMGCAVAKRSIELLDEFAASETEHWAPFRKEWQQQQEESVWSMWSPDVVRQLSFSDRVESVMTLGSVLAVELKDEANKGYGSTASQSIVQSMRRNVFTENGSEATINLFARPLGNIIYLMTSQISTPERVRQCERILLQCIQSSSN
ncbi:pyridoxal phosphate-dependent transferase [Radiomyces spectabilis]|uniref:pyridoxal phosphate-dependent transferase n=1 Tax=Radiomyces spectabilis TaxID=64574 RepID=UPI00221E4CE3|nr:pyridoxal phosphate-dependent transferase [Radiomyces spectabilis]KAI8384266.1 pyridoxal phosphate-dependent transferase [Radiomyces spectabilis]